MSMYRPFASRRNSSKASQNKSARSREFIQSAAWHAVEKLETRRLFAQGSELMGGGLANGVAQERSYTYLDANGSTDKIALFGNITAEFIFAHVSSSTNGVTLSGAVAPTTTNIAADAGADLFAIYISSASPTASISIGTETNTTTGLVGGFTTASYTLTVRNAQTGKTLALSPTAGSGDVYIGARSYTKTATGAQTVIAAGVPLLSVPLSTQVGVRPVTGDDTLYAGIVSAPGVSLNRILIGGMLTGRVDLGGSINTFYAGDIYTGDAEGISAGSQPSGALVRNFNVAGDLGDLLSVGSIGTNTGVNTGKLTYETGFRLSVGGHISEVKSYDSFYGSVYAQNLSTLKGLGTSQQEIEGSGVTPDAMSGQSFFEGNAPDSLGNFTGPALNGDPTINDNGSFANAQFLGTPFSSTQGHNAIQLQGSLDNGSMVNDDLDVYAVALGADQTITATLTTAEADIGTLDLGIFAPDAATSSSTTALLASTYSAKNSLALANQPVTFTSTDAGIYYFSIAYAGDSAFNGTDPSIVGNVSYELDVTGVKNIGIGAVAAVNNVEFSSGSQPSVRVDTGDLGAVVSTSSTGLILSGDALGDGAGLASPITATTGNIRAIQAGSIGTKNGNLVSFAPDIRSAGNVGLIRTTETEADGGFMALNINSLAAIGGSYQLVDCAGLFASSLMANVGIGTIRAEDVGLMNFAPILHVNANDKGSDGVIDLIDVTGNGTASSHFGTLDAGGPQITTGPGGNVRYIHVAPDVTVYNDAFFGGQQDGAINYGAGKTASLIDDSGTPFTIVPFRGTVVQGDATGTTSTSTSTTSSTDTSTIAGDSLSIEDYGIRDKGGVVVISVTATAGNVTINPGGVPPTTTTTTTGAGAGPTSISVDTSAAGSKGSVEFGQIDMVGGGTTLTYDAATQVFTAAPGGTNTAAEDDSASFNGESPIDIYDYAVTTTALKGGDGAEPLAGATSVVNNTSGGEIVNFQAQDVETLEAGSLGIAKSHTGAPVAGATIMADTFPFHDQRNLIQIGGTMVPDDGTADVTTGTVGFAKTIESTGPLGDIVTNGTLGNVLANTDKKATKGQVDGIDAPIYAASPGAFTGTGAASPMSGNIDNINIGQGLGFSGSGDYAVTGIFADNYIGNVTNQGEGSDIRGTIAASGDAGGRATETTTTDPTSGVVTVTTNAGVGPYIGNITLSDGGSLIGAEIAAPTTLIQTLQTNANGYILTDPNQTVNANNSNAQSAVGSISLTGNGGIIGTFMLAGGFNSISVKGGFGIIDSLIESLSNDVVGSIRADGYGIRSTVISGQNSIDSIDLTGTGKELKTTSFSPSVLQSESGATTDAFSGQPLNGSNDLFDFLGTTAKTPTRRGATEAGVLADTTLTGSLTLGTLTAWRIVGHPATVAKTEAQTIAQEIAATPAMTINFAAGIGKILVAENTTDLSVTTGSLNTFESGDNVVTTTFNVAGEIKTMTAGFFSGTTTINDSGPDGNIDYLATTGGFNANVNALAGIGELLVGTDLGSTDVTSGGNLDELYVKGSVLKGADVTVARAINTLTIRHNLLGGSTIQARSIGTKTIGGVTNGNIIITPSM